MVCSEAVRHSVAGGTTTVNVQRFFENLALAAAWRTTLGRVAFSRYLPGATSDNVRASTSKSTPRIAGSDE